MSLGAQLYSALRFVATWLQQPTLIEVAGSVTAKSAEEPVRRSPK
jgi:hypothetical protein